MSHNAITLFIKLAGTIETASQQARFKGLNIRVDIEQRIVEIKDFLKKLELTKRFMDELARIEAWLEQQSEKSKSLRHTLGLLQNEERKLRETAEHVRSTLSLDSQPVGEIPSSLRVPTRHERLKELELAIKKNTASQTELQEELENSYLKGRKTRANNLRVQIEELKAARNDCPEMTKKARQLLRWFERANNAAKEAASTTNALSESDSTTALRAFMTNEGLDPDNESDVELAMSFFVQSSVAA